MQIGFTIFAHKITINDCTKINNKGREIYINNGKRNARME